MIIIALAVCHGLIVLAFTARIILRDDLSPPARLAWFIVLNALPYFGSAIYFLFGETDIGHHATARHREVFEEIGTRARHLMGEPGATDKLIASAYRPAFHYAGSINGLHTVPGNSAELMADATQTRDRMIRDMDEAADHIHVLYYIWLDDETGRGIAQALMRAAARGVTCRAMADGMGSRALIRSPLWRSMQEGGVEVAVTLPLDRPLRTILTSRIDLRNHRKITVIDGRITYCGSRNSADPEFRVKPAFAPWIDIMLRFEGPVVAQNQVLFTSDWMIAAGTSLSEMPLDVATPGTGFPAQVIADGPTLRPGATPQLFSGLIACARNSITISTPYFVPDATLLEALCAAAYRGVAVTLIFPARNDSWIVAAASRSYYRRLLEAGCTIFEFHGGLLHAKTFTMDDSVTVIGSTNLDLRSFDLNYENDILLQDKTITGAVHSRQKDYIASAQPVVLADVLVWSRPRRAWYNVIATIGPIL